MAGTVASAPSAAAHSKGNVGHLARTAVKAAMIVLALFQMTRQFLPGTVHEVTGICLGLCVVAHVVQNRRWFTSFTRGRWGAARIGATVVDVALVAILIAMVASGVAMSGLAVQLGLAKGTAALRGVHMACVHGGFLLMAVHAGMHGRPLVSRGLQTLNSLPARLGAALIVALLCVWGAWEFVRLDFMGYLTLRTRFAFIDPSQSVVLFVLDHAAIFALFVVAGYGLVRLLGVLDKPRHPKQPTR